MLSDPHYKGAFAVLLAVMYALPCAMAICAAIGAMSLLRRDPFSGHPAWLEVHLHRPFCKAVKTLTGEAT